MYACENGFEQIAKMLISKVYINHLYGIQNCALDLVDKYGISAVMYAAMID